MTRIKDYLVTRMSFEDNIIALLRSRTINWPLIIFKKRMKVAQKKKSKLTFFAGQHSHFRKVI